MRRLQPLAIAVLCPLAVAAVGCGRIIQPIGEYKATQRSVGITTGDGQASDPNGSKDAEAPASLDGAVPTMPQAGFGAEAGPPTNSTGTALPPPSQPTTASQIPTLLDGCAITGSAAAERPRLDMYIIADGNITLPYTGLQQLVTNGLRDFVTDRRSQQLGVGIRYFGLECDPDPYDLQPTVEVDLVSNDQNAIIASTMGLKLSASPMQPAVQGGIQHQRKRAMMYPSWKQVVVLLTDGFTQDFTCRYTEQDIQNSVSDGFNQSPSIETYVIGFGLPSTNSTVADDILARFSPLDSIAAAGGTHSATIVHLGDDASAINEALQSVRREAQPCAYIVPPDFDPQLLNLTLIPGGPVPRVDSAMNCGQLPGFFYDSPSAPTTMVLCPASCKPLQTSDTETGVLLNGCPTLRR